MGSDRMAMRAVVEQAREAGSYEELGATLMEAARRLIGVSGGCLMPVLPDSPIGEESTTFHEQFSADHMQQQTLRWFPATVRDVGRIEDLARAGRTSAFDVNERVGGSAFARTETFNEYWRPCRIERQLLTIWEETSNNKGFLCVSRSVAEPRFDDDDVAQLAILGDIAARESRRLLAARCEQASVLLAGLAEGMPMACALIDSSGRLLWSSSVAVPELVARSGEWTSVALRCLTEGMQCQQGDLLAQRIATNSGTPMVFVVGRMRKAGSRLGERVDDAQVAWRLTARETDVLEQLARGLANKEIAQALAIAARTVEVHLTNIFRKARCSSRSELLARLWTIHSPL